MNTNEIRFHIIRLFFMHQPEDGWTVDRLVKALGEIAELASDKPVRTFLNNLSDRKTGILNVTWYEGTKHYFLNRENMVFDDLSDQVSHEANSRASDTLAMLVTSFLELMGQEDAGPASNGLIKRLGFTYGNPKRWIRIKDERQMIHWQNMKLFGATLRDLDLVGQLLGGGEKKPWKISLLDGTEHLFVFRKVVVRQGVLLCIGSDGKSKYFEMLPSEIRDLQETRGQTVPFRSQPALEQRVDLSHLSIGQPKAGQDEEIELSMTSDEAMENIQAISLPLDSELDTSEFRLLLWHQVSTDLADWIIGLGPDVKVVRPVAMRDLVIRRLHEIMSIYG